MKINRSSFLFKYAYMGVHSDDVPNKTTLCAFFWRCVFRTCLYCVPIVAIAGYITLLVVAVVPTVAGTVWAAFMITFLNWANRRNEVRKIKARTKTPKPPSATRQLISTTIWGIKNKVCPVIEIEKQ